MNKRQTKPKLKAIGGQPRDSRLPAFERLLKLSAEIQHFSFRLYVTGTTARSTRAVSNIRSLCEEFLPGHYDLEVVDIYQHPAVAIEQQIVAAPTLIKQLPKPLQRIIGDLSDRKKILMHLSLGEKSE